MRCVSASRISIISILADTVSFTGGLGLDSDPEVIAFHRTASSSALVCPIAQVTMGLSELHLSKVVENALEKRFDRHQLCGGCAGKSMMSSRDGNPVVRLFRKYMRTRQENQRRGSKLVLQRSRMAELLHEALDKSIASMTGVELELCLVSAIQAQLIRLKLGRCSPRSEAPHLVVE